MSQRTVLVDGAAFSAEQKKRGMSHKEFLEYLVSQGCELSDRTLRKYKASPDKPHLAYRKALEKIAAVLDLPFERLVILDVRDCSGVWKVSGRDLQVPGIFEYAHGAKSLEAELTVTMDGRRLRAEGRDHDNDPMTIDAELREGGNVIYGTYRVDNPRMIVYGTIIMRYLPCGKRMEGFYLGRATGQGSELILGQVEAELRE